MRLFHVITALHTGGAERMLANLSHAWAGQHTLHVAYLKPIDTLAGAFHPSADLHAVGLGPDTVGKLRGLYKATQAQIVHTHLVHADFLGLMAGQGLGLPLFMTAHNAFFRTGPSDALFQTAYRLLLGTLAAETQVVAISDAVARHAHNRWGVSQARIHTCLNPLQPPKPQLTRAEARQHLGLHPSEPVFTFLGRLEPQKGLTYLLQALAELKQTHPQPMMYIVGEGSLRDDLSSQAATLGLDAQKLIFTGLSDQPGLYLAAADALVLPSLFEGLGNVIAEAFSFGVPAIASDLEGPAEIIEHGKTGLLVPKANPVALAQALGQFINNTALAAQMGHFARLRAAGWPSVQQYADQLIELYEQRL